MGGVELLRAADERLGICKAASKLMCDPRKQRAVTHQWEALVRQRISAIAPGFSDLNDHQQLRQRLVNIGAVVIRNTRRIVMKPSSAALQKENFLIALQRLEEK